MKYALKALKALHKALVLDGEMSRPLYEYELEDNLKTWRKSLRRDKDEFLVVVTENSSEVAMCLLTREIELFINEAARQKLRAMWHTPGVYENNMKLFIPMMLECFEAGELWVMGVKTVATSS